jgi:hypothetical protein
MPAPTDYIDCATREELRALAKQSYDIDPVTDFIVSPGPFEAEDIDILLFHDYYMNGDPGAEDFSAQDDGSGVNWYVLDPHTLAILDYPLTAHSPDGAVSCDFYPARYARLSSDSRGFWYLYLLHGHSDYRPGRRAPRTLYQTADYLADCAYFNAEDDPTDPTDPTEV